MKLASLKEGRDGRLVVVSRDLARYADAAATLQIALEKWDEAEPELREIADALEAAAGTTVERTYAGARPGELRHSCLDWGRARRAGWTPETTLAEGLRQTYRHIAAEEAVR